MTKNIDKLFLALSSLQLVAGVAMGAFMGMQKDYSLAPLHAHINLIGWLSLAVFGLAYRAFPELGSTRNRWLHFSLSALGAVVFPIGLYLELIDLDKMVILVASSLWIAGAILFAGMAMRMLWSDQGK